MKRSSYIVIALTISLLGGGVGRAKAETTVNLRGESYDSCGKRSVNELADTWHYSAYWAIGYYLGGNTSCDNEAWKSGSGLDYLGSAERIGFNHYPYFVGRQPTYKGYNATVGTATCLISQKSKPAPEWQISNNAWNEGISDAMLAVQELGNRMGRPHDSVIVLDVENYNINDSQCKWLANLYITAWSTYLIATNHRPILYTSVNGANAYGEYVRSLLERNFPYYANVLKGVEIALYTNNIPSYKTNYPYTNPPQNGHQYTSPVLGDFRPSPVLIPLNRVCISGLTNGYHDYSVLPSRGWPCF